MVTLTTLIRVWGIPKHGDRETEGLYIVIRAIPRAFVLAALADYGGLVWVVLKNMGRFWL